MDETTSSRMIALTGAAGFVGRAVAEELVRRGHTVNALVRDVDKAKRVLPRDSVRMIVGGVFDADARAALVEGADAVIHLIGIRRELGRGVTFQRLHVDATRVMLEAAAAAGIRRWVQMSALGVRADAPSVYHRTKHAAETLVRQSGMRWTIFRPSVIHGPDGEFMQMMRGMLTGEEPPYKFLPHFFRENPATGEATPGRAQPVHVDDVAFAFAESLDRAESVGEVYALGGPDAYDWPDLMIAMRDTYPWSKKSLKPLGLSGRFASCGALAAEKLGMASLLPFGNSEPLMAMEDNTCSTAKARAHLGLEPRGFISSFRAYAHEL